MRLADLRPPLALPSPHAWLSKLHGDLFKIHAQVRTNSDLWPSALSTFEKLVLALEDRNFFYHAGFDLKSAVRELIRALTFQRHGGASTIDMQFVRTATGYKERTLRRKIYETLLAVIIERRYNKVVILRSYLEIAYFGTHLRGATQTALTLYGGGPDDLEMDNAADLAALLVYPRPRSPSIAWFAKVRRRADYGKRVYIRYKKRFDQLPRRK